MRDLDGRIFLSATDLMRFTGCPHATTLDLLQKQGDAHEAAHLALLKEAGRTVMEIERGKLGENAEATHAALAAGPDVVFQGAFLSGNWSGWSDFLERVETPSALGSFSYEVADTKLKRRADPKHVLQLVLYSDLLAEIQGAVPEFAHVELGDGTRATLRLADYSAYARMARGGWKPSSRTHNRPARYHVPIAVFAAGLIIATVSGRPKTACSMLRVSAVVR
jgi:predicted RecB family nuclease